MTIDQTPTWDLEMEATDLLLLYVTTVDREPDVAREYLTQRDAVMLELGRREAREAFRKLPLVKRLIQAIRAS
jgi:hypothetical protein